MNRILLSSLFLLTFFIRILILKGIDVFCNYVSMQVDFVYVIR